MSAYATAGLVGLYPSVWISQEVGRGWWITVAYGGDREVSHLELTPLGADRLAKIWREDLAKGRDLTCPECLGEGELPCPSCEGSGRGVVRLTWSGTQIIGDCPRTRPCESCKGEAILVE